MSLYRTRIPGQDWQRAHPHATDPFDAARRAWIGPGTTHVDVATDAADNRNSRGEPLSWVTLTMTRAMPLNAKEELAITDARFEERNRKIVG